MTRIVPLVATIAALSAGCQWMPGRPTAADYPEQPSAVLKFATLYSENCAGCHGANGRGGAALPLNNPIYLSMIDDGALRSVVADGVNGTAMPPFLRASGGPLTTDQVEVLVAGIRSNWGAARTAGVPPHSSSVAGDPSRGASVYASYCQNCHGPGGNGARAGSIVNPSFLALVSNQYLRSIIVAGRPDLSHPNWNTYSPGHPMSATEVSDIVAWLASKRSPVMAASIR